VPVRVDTGLRVDPSLVPQDPACRLPMAWSPDSQWLAYVKVLENNLHALFIYSEQRRQSYPITDGASDVLHVAFDKAGEYLYFTGSTEVGLAGDWMAMSSFGRPARRSVYALLLNKMSPSLFLSNNHDDEALAKARVQRDVTVKIDLDGIARRIICLPVPARNYSSVVAGHPGQLFLVESPIEQPFAGRPQQVHLFDLAHRNSERVLEDIIYFELSFNGEKMLYAKSHDQKRQWYIAAAQNSRDGAKKAAARRVPLDSMQVYVDPRIEWNHLFEQVWRVQRDFFYDPGLHGLDLEEAKNTYRPFLENIVNRNDLYYLFGEMLANLNVGHLWALPGEALSRKPRTTGLLGADYRVEHGRYRLTHIYESDPWGPTAVRAPLTEPGRSVRVGEYLLAVDGRDVHPSTELFSYFENTAGKPITLTVGHEPDGTHSRRVIVVPVDDEYLLRYFAWTEGNRRRVDELSDGRVAYLHLPDCGAEGYAAFNRYFFSQAGKDAAIIDVRYNNGGHFPDYIIDCLKRPLMRYHHTRDGQDVADPSAGIFGPKVMLVNEMAGSSGDALPWMFRKARIGPSIGTRTWGGSIGFYCFAHDLLDDGLLTNPNFASYTPEGEWGAENCGVSPDIEMEEDPKAARIGRDVQLERAIEVAMTLLQKTPLPRRPSRPAYPRSQY
jgi:tricorn protease